MLVFERHLYTVGFIRAHLLGYSLKIWWPVFKRKRVGMHEARQSTELLMQEASLCKQLRELSVFLVAAKVGTVAGACAAVGP